MDAPTLSNQGGAMLLRLFGIHTGTLIVDQMRSEQDYAHRMGGRASLVLTASVGGFFLSTSTPFGPEDLPNFSTMTIKIVRVTASGADERVLELSCDYEEECDRLSGFLLQLHQTDSLSPRALTLDDMARHAGILPLQPKVVQMAVATAPLVTPPMPPPRSHSPLCLSQGSMDTATCHLPIQPAEPEPAQRQQAPPLPLPIPPLDEEPIAWWRGRKGPYPEAPLAWQRRVDGLFDPVPYWRRREGEYPVGPLSWKSWMDQIHPPSRPSLVEQEDDASSVYHTCPSSPAHPERCHVGMAADDAPLLPLPLTPAAMVAPPRPHTSSAADDDAAEDDSRYFLTVYHSQAAPSAAVQSRPLTAAHNDAALAIGDNEEEEVDAMPRLAELDGAATALHALPHSSPPPLNRDALAVSLPASPHPHPAEHANKAAPPAADNGLEMFGAIEDARSAAGAGDDWKDFDMGDHYGGFNGQDATDPTDVVMDESMEDTGVALDGVIDGAGDAVGAADVDIAPPPAAPLPLVPPPFSPLPPPSPIRRRRCASAGDVADGAPPAKRPRVTPPYVQAAIDARSRLQRYVKLNLKVATVVKKVTKSMVDPTLWTAWSSVRQVLAHRFPRVKKGAYAALHAFTESFIHDPNNCAQVTAYAEKVAAILDELKALMRQALHLSLRICGRYQASDLPIRAICHTPSLIYSPDLARSRPVRSPRCRCSGPVQRTRERPPRPVSRMDGDDTISSILVSPSPSRLSHSLSHSVLCHKKGTPRPLKWVEPVLPVCAQMPLEAVQQMGSKPGRRTTPNFPLQQFLSSRRYSILEWWPWIKKQRLLYHRRD